jgi:hypothetical protein
MGEYIQVEANYLQESGIMSSWKEKQPVVITRRNRQPQP